VAAEDKNLFHTILDSNEKGIAAIGQHQWGCLPPLQNLQNLCHPCYMDLIKRKATQWGT